MTHDIFSLGSLNTWYFLLHNTIYTCIYIRHTVLLYSYTLVQVSQTGDPREPSAWAVNFAYNEVSWHPYSSRGSELNFWATNMYVYSISFNQTFGMFHLIHSLIILTFYSRLFKRYESRNFENCPLTLFVIFHISIYCYNCCCFVWTTVKLVFLFFILYIDINLLFL